jgi:DNA-binding transcriptional ArsR family regulator
MTTEASDNGVNSALVAKKLSALFSVLAHRHRIQIVHALRNAPMDVSSLCESLEVNQSAMSQHLAALRSHHLVVERRDGRRVYYSLVIPEMARWLLEGTQYIGSGIEESGSVITAVREVREFWLDKSSERGKSKKLPKGNSRSLRSVK